MNVKRDMLGAVLVATTIVLAAIADTTHADAIMLSGTTIPLRDCRVEDFRSGRVYYADARGRRQWRQLVDVDRISFDDLPALDEAEKLLAAEEYDAGLAKLLVALLNAKDERQELWVRVRLIRAHEFRREYLQAVGHMARVFALRDESYWRIMEPVVEPAPASYPVALETLEALRAARRAVRDPELRVVVKRLQEVVQPLYDAARSSYDGPEIEPGSTRSGYLVDHLRKGALVLPTAASSATPLVPAEAVSTPAAPNRSSPTRASPDRKTAPPGARAERATEAAPMEDSPEAIDRLLERGRHDEAVASCERVARRPGARRLDRFLHQFGRALLAAGRSEDAAVMFMRCAVNFDASVYAAPSLLETARIYREVYLNERSARRLLGRAIAVAERRTPAQDDVIEQARALLGAADAKPEPGK